MSKMLSRYYEFLNGGRGGGGKVIHGTKFSFAFLANIRWKLL